MAAAPTAAPTATPAAAKRRRVGVLGLGVVGLGYLGDGLMHGVAHMDGDGDGDATVANISLSRAVARERKVLIPSPLSANQPPPQLA